MSVDMPDVAGSAYWESVWRGAASGRVVNRPAMAGQDVWDRLLPTAEGTRFLEIGCMPGGWLVYFAKFHRYDVEGIDYCDDVSVVYENLRLNDITGIVHRQDVFDYTPDGLYDVVFSHGFVEHFDDPVAPVRRHAELVRPGGIVAMTVPNVTRLNKWFMQRYAPEAYSVHRFELMELVTLRRTCESVGLRTLHCGYERRTFHMLTALPGRRDLILRGAERALRLLRLERLPNRWMSPYLLYVGRRGNE